MSDALDPMDLAERRGNAAAEKIIEEVAANSLEAASIHRLESLVRHGYKFIDITVRKDGNETKFEGDWLARLFRQEVSPPKAAVGIQDPWVKAILKL